MCLGEDVEGLLGRKTKDVLKIQIHICYICMIYINMHVCVYECELGKGLKTVLAVENVRG